MKLGLILNAINPKIGGVLIRGEKGTAKSTAVRALANLLPEIEVTPGCPYNCHPGESCPLQAEHRQEADRRAKKVSKQHERAAPPPVETDPPLEPMPLTPVRAPKPALSLPSTRRAVEIVEMPVGATDDRVVGSLDVGRALAKGSVRFKPGLLAAANHGILYIDEVNLLNDHLVDVLLDAAAMGRNYVQREGISFQHPAQFLLVGTMNPEEGDLRPQLLDRFALSVDVAGDLPPADRAQVVRRRIAFERSPARFAHTWQPAERAERRRIAHAQRLLGKVQLDERMLDLITHICSSFQVDGLRADIVMYKTAITIAAYNGRVEVNDDDVRQAAELALPHRRRRQPFQSPEADREQLDQTIRQHLDRPDGDEGLGGGDGPAGGDTEDRVFDIGQRLQPRPLGASKAERVTQPHAGRRTKLRLSGRQGHYVGSREPDGEVQDLALDATLRASALRRAQQRTDPASSAPGQRDRKAAARKVAVMAQDVRVKVRETKLANLILFAVDASGSMAAMDRMAAAKGAVMSLLLDAYQKRDEVGMIAFRGRFGEVLLPPTNSVDLAERQLRELPTGGRTPLSHALQLGLVTIDRHKTLHRDAVPLFVLISDGRPNVSLLGGDPVAESRLLGAQFAHKRIQSVVIDTEGGPGLRLGLARTLAADMGGQYLRLEELDASRVAGVVRGALGRGN